MTRYLPPIIFAMLGAFYLSQAKGFNDPTSGQAPSLYGYAILAVAALVLVVSYFRSRLEIRKAGEEPLNLRKALVIFAILCGFVALIFVAGFYIAIPAFLLVFLSVFARLPLWLSCAAALTATALVWAIFGQLLHLQVFGGYLAL